MLATKMQESKPILQLIVVGFHHKKGYQVGVFPIYRVTFIICVLVCACARKLIALSRTYGAQSSNVQIQMSHKFKLLAY